MKNLSKFIAVSAVLGFLILVPVQAVLAENSTYSGHAPGDPNTRILKHLEKLEDQGYDVSAIRAAVENGDMETARELLRQFMEEHRDELPNSSGKSDRILKHLEKLEEQGYDVSAIRAAVDNGDMETARELLRQFMEEHRDELPSPPEGGMRGKHCQNPPTVE